MDKDNTMDTSQNNEIKESTRKKSKEDSPSLKKENRESIESFLYKKEKEDSKRVVTPRLKRVFISILARNKGDKEKSWSELWA